MVGMDIDIRVLLGLHGLFCCGLSPSRSTSTETEKKIEKIEKCSE